MKRPLFEKVIPFISEHLRTHGIREGNGKAAGITLHTIETLFREVIQRGIIDLSQSDRSTSFAGQATEAKHGR